MLPYMIGGVVAVLAFVLGGLFGYQRRRATAEREIGSAEEEAKRIVNEAYKSAESKKREALVEAKEEILKARNEYEREEKERRADLQKQERRLQQKEENLDRKTENMERKEEHLSNRLAKLEATQAEAEEIKQSQMEVLERISGFTAEEAKKYLLDQLEADVTHESAMKIKEIEARFKDEADTKAREIISLAIQRCAADHVAEATVSVVPLPNDEMKGRIIGREGRNIRTLETLTGVDLIIDDTPEAITVSCFDPVRREIARLALEKLILDGRIHPARIEEMVEKAKREVDATIKAEGERAVFETNVHGLHPELVKLLGRMHYRTSYGQNVLNHSIEVSHIAGLLAAEIGANVAEAKRAGLLHDLGKSIDHEVEGSHVTIGVELAKKFRVNLEVVSSLERKPGTKIKEVTKVEKTNIAGVAKDTSIARVALVGLQHNPGVAFQVFDLLSKHNINVDVILQSIGREDTKDITFTVHKKDLEESKQILEEHKETLRFDHIETDESIGKVSIVGAGLMSNCGVAARMFEALYEAGINIQMINTSEIRVSVLLDEEDVNRAVRAIHDKFFGEI